MYRNSGFPAALFGLLAVAPVFAQQPKFEIADVHLSLRPEVGPDPVLLKIPAQRRSRENVTDDTR